MHFAGGKRLFGLTPAAAAMASPLLRLSLPPEATLEDAIVAMTTTKASSIAVVDAAAGERVVGVITESDVVWAAADCLTRRTVPHSLPIASLLSDRFGRARATHTGVVDAALASSDVYQRLALQMGAARSKNLPVVDSRGAYMGTLTALSATKELLRMRDADEVRPPVATAHAVSLPRYLPLPSLPACSGWRRRRGAWTTATTRYLSRPP